MLINFDLHDLHAILINIQAYPEYELNEEIANLAQGGLNYGYGIWGWI